MNKEPMSPSAGATFKPGLGTAFSVGFGILDYVQQKNEGASFLEAASSATLNTILPEIMGGWAYFGLMGAQMLAEGGMSVYENAKMQMRQMDRNNRNQQPFQGYTFVDGPQIYTMRQAGLALAQQTKYNLHQTMMGNEAKYMHR